MNTIMLADDLKGFLKGEVLNDKQTLARFSKDASLFEVTPEVVVAPKNSQDLKLLVNFVSQQRSYNKHISLTPRSAGTDMSGGPLSSSIVLDMTRHFNRIIEIGTDFARVEPGVYYRDLDKETRRRDLFLPSYPASRELCTVGGMVANNSGGEKTLAYGKTERYVRELKVVLADGNEYTVVPLSKKDLDIKMKLRNFEGQLYKKIFSLIEKNAELIADARPHVSKNSAGYYLWNVWDPQTKQFDLTKLIIGSQGTLGIITEIKFGIVPVHRISKMAVIFLKDLSRLGKIVVEVMQAKPESFESYDNHTLKLAVKYWREILKSMKGNAVKLFFKFLPEFGMLITGGLPKLVLMAEFTGDDEGEVDGRMRDLVERMNNLNVPVRLADEAGSQKYWTIRRESFNLLRQKIKNRQTAPFIDDIIVKPEYLPEFLPKLSAILDQYRHLIYTIAGHAGDGNFHIIPLMNLKDPVERAIIPKLSEAVYDLVLQYHGSITAEHNDGLIRTPYLEKMYGPKIVRLFEEVKMSFDSENIFNPGKKVFPQPGFAFAHIKKS